VFEDVKTVNNCLRFFCACLRQHVIFFIFVAMAKWLHRLLFVVISLSFFISATEMDIGEAHNTFFDEYDTYVQTEQVEVDHVEVRQQQQELYEFVSFLINYYHPAKEIALPIRPGYFTSGASPPPLFLRNSVWRI
jgi:hypothetical protein